MRGRIDVQDDLAMRDANNLVKFLIRRGVLAGDPGRRRTSRIRAVAPLQALAQIRSPIAGVAVFRHKPGDVVRRGTKLADVVDPCAGNHIQARHSVKSPTAGLFFSRNLSRFVRRGQSFCKIVAEKALSEDRGGFLED
jgi:hypothetical protein